MNKLSSKNKEVLIKNIPPTLHSDAYISVRDKVWAAQAELMKSKNKPFWNGTVYYLDSLSETEDKVFLNISTCEYKDIVLKEAQIISFEGRLASKNG